jgi:hypothetical protein
MPTSDHVLQEQLARAETERKAALARSVPPPLGLTPLQRKQWKAWGWCDLRPPRKQKFHETRPADGRVADDPTADLSDALYKLKDHSDV